MTDHWARYNASRADREPRPLSAALIEAAGPGEGRLAIDLGAGSGVETGALLAAGWRVLAIDGDASTAERIRARASDPTQLEVRTQDFAELDALPRASLVHASYSLPFAAEHLDQVWAAVRAALVPGGWFGGQIFGDRDSFAATGMRAAFCTREQVLAALDGLEIVTFDEEDADGDSFSGPKHWHVFHVIARRSA